MSDSWEDADSEAVIDEQAVDDQSQEQVPETPETQEEVWTKAAALDERAKRQALERELGEANQRLARLEGASEARNKPADSSVEDLIQYDDLAATIPKAVEATVNRILEGQTTKREEQRALRLNAKVRSSIEMAREDFDDYDEVIKTWDTQATKDHALVERMYASPDPAKYAYRWAKRQGNGDALKKANERIAELEAEAAGKPLPKQRASVATGTGRSAKPGKQGLDPGGVLDDALEGR